MEEKKVIHENPSESHEEEEEDEITESIDGGGGGSSSSLHFSELSGQRREVPFNLGVGFGIIYLIVASKHELNKMVQLSNQMETLLQHLKFTFQNTQKHHPNSSSSSSSEEAHYSDIENNNNYSLSLDVDVDVNMKGKGNKGKNMDQLEAELEVELEHLQVQLDSEVTEISVEDSAPREEISNKEYSESSFDEQKIVEFEYSKSEPNLNYYYSNNNGNGNGVCPVELERKLQEVVAMRQEEKIKALESALDCAIQKLHQNQNELSWWKDTAPLAFHTISPP